MRGPRRERSAPGRGALVVHALSVPIELVTFDVELIAVKLCELQEQREPPTDSKAVMVPSAWWSVAAGCVSSQVSIGTSFSPRRRAAISAAD